MGNLEKSQTQGRGQVNIRVVASSYRFLAFAIATIQIFLFPPMYQPIIPPIALVSGVGLYTLIKAWQSLRWQQTGVIGYSLLGLDVAICITLVLLTGGIYSPFLLYTLAPVLTAALFLAGKITFGIAGLSITYVITSHVINPFFATQLYLPELSYFTVYIIAACLTAVLPYLINVNLRQRLQSQGILQERRRLSREIHDGAAQTVSALQWQAQLVSRQLLEMGINLNEVKELISLAEKAQHETRESLELLRNYTGNGSFLPHLKDYLKHLVQDTGINFNIDIETEKLHLDAIVELELLRICQEALVNVRKHSRGHNVWIRVRLVNEHVEVRITDDGCGFDVLKYYHDGIQAKGHGLEVMRERAESVGGRWRVVSMPGQGTEIQIEVPCVPNRAGVLWQSR